MQKISVIIPAKDEENTISAVIKQAKKYSDDVIVVDGNSHDRTKEISTRLKVKVITENKGKGYALREAAKEARNDILVFIDADGSHNVNDIGKLMAPICEGKADLVIGSRVMGGSDEFYGSFEKQFRVWASYIINKIINIRWSTDLTDVQNGYRAIRKSVFQELNLTENTFQIEQEMVMKCLKAGYKISEVPSHEYSRRYGHSRINLVTEGPKYIISLLSQLW